MSPATPAPRDAHTYDGEQAPRPPSFNEDDVSDKPPIDKRTPQTQPTEQIAQIDAIHEKRAESLQALDDLVEGVVSKLKRAGVLDNTYIFFTSDNGWQSGEHRITSQKRRFYEESIRMPLLVRGPGCGRLRHQQAYPQHRLLADVYGPGGCTDAQLRRWALFATRAQGGRLLLTGGPPSFWNVVTTVEPIILTASALPTGGSISSTGEASESFTL